MAKSKWNNQPAAQELLTRIESLKLHSGQESPQVFSHKDFNSSFSSKNMKHYSMLLKDIAKFNSEVPDSVKQELVDNAIWTSADANKLQDGYVGNVLKKNEENYLNRPLKEFVLITGLNISGLNNNRRIKTPDSTIIISNNIPNKFKKNYNYSQVELLYPRINMKNYSWLTIEISARCIHSATEIAFEQLDFWRGIMNLFLNYNYERISFGTPSPINKICKFPYHSLHLKSGESATDLYWFEPNYSESSSTIDFSERYNQAIEFYKEFTKSINKSGESTFLIKIIARYCSSLDTTDMNSAFLAMWSLLESLTFTGKETYDITISRALVLFKDKFQFKLELEILRNKRNMAIHSGSQFDEAEKYSYMLLKIVHEYLIFLVSAITKCKSIDQLKSVLDLPIDKSKLIEKRAHLKSESDKLDLLEKIIKIE